MQETGKKEAGGGGEKRGIPLNMTLPSQSCEGLAEQMGGQVPYPWEGLGRRGRRPLLPVGFQWSREAGGGKGISVGMPLPLSLALRGVTESERRGLCPRRDYRG